MEKLRVVLFVATMLFAAIGPHSAEAADVYAIQNTNQAVFQDYNWFPVSYDADVARNAFTVDIQWPNHRLINLGIPYDTPTMNPTYAASPYFCSVSTTAMTNFTVSYYVSCSANLPTTVSISSLFQFRVWGYQIGVEYPDGDCTILAGTCDLLVTGLTVHN